MSKNVIRILLLGKSGVGKSSFINYFLGKDIAAVGNGEPVTQEQTKYTLEEWKDCSIEIYDTKGLEALDADNWRNKILADIQNKNNGDITEWYHTIFYCISANNRIEDYEWNLLEDIKSASNHYIHIILTNCDGATEEKLLEYEQKLKRRLGEQVRIYRVVSVNMKKRTGAVVQSGREEVLDSVFRLFWYDMVSSISQKTSATIREYFKSFLLTLKRFCDNFINENANVIKVIQYIANAINENVGINFEEAIDGVAEPLENLLDLMNLSSKTCLTVELAAANILYNAYSNIALKKPLVDSEELLEELLQPIQNEIEAALDMDDYETEEFLKNNLKLGEIVDLIDEIDELEDFDSASGIFGAIRFFGKAAKTGIQSIFSIKKDLLRIVDNVYYEVCDKIDDADFEGMIYEKLCSAFDEKNK